MRAILRLFPISRADAQRAAALIATIDRRRLAEAAVVAAVIAINLAALCALGLGR